MPSIREPEWLAGNMILQRFFTQTLLGLAHCAGCTHLTPAHCHSTGNDYVHQSQAEKAEIVYVSL
jgi:hypothetical protein